MSSLYHKRMIIIVGLGNPGEKFEKTRHNVGFDTVSLFAKKHSLGDFELEKKFDAEILKSKKIFLAKPQTFMNESGKAVKKIMAINRGANLVVIHDDLDLPVGKHKVVKNRGSAGHKGVESIIKSVGNKNLVRFRIGIQPLKKKTMPETFVVGKFTEEEQKLATKAIKKTVDALDIFIEKGLEQTMNEYNR